MIKIIEGNLRVLLSETRESDNGKKLSSNRKGQNQTGLTISNNLGMSRKGKRKKRRQTYSFVENKRLKMTTHDNNKDISIQ